MITLLYTSETKQPWTDADLDELLEVSRDRNADARITGMLLYAPAGFMQQIEGPAAEVDALYRIISRDPRHHGLRRLTRHDIVKRRFSHWTMGFHRVADERVRDGGSAPWSAAPNRHLTAKSAEAFMTRYGNGGASAGGL